MEVVDWVVVMSQGNIEQVDVLECVWCELFICFVLEFMGEVNCLQGVICGGQFYVGVYCWLLGYILVYQGLVDLFLCLWEVDISWWISLDLLLLVQVLEVSLKGYYI